METAAMAHSLHSLALRRLGFMARVQMVLLLQLLVLNQPVCMAVALPLAAHILSGLFFK